MRRRRGNNPPQTDHSAWLIANKLELDWIIGELVWMRAGRHPHLAKIVCDRYPLCRDDTALLQARMHEWMYVRMLSDSPGRMLEGMRELYRLLEDTAHDFNRTVLDSHVTYPLDPDGPWPFAYWSYVRRNSHEIVHADRKACDPYEYKTAYLLIDGADAFYYDRVRRAQTPPITVGEVPKDELEPPSVS